LVRKATGGRFSAAPGVVESDEDRAADSGWYDTWLPSDPCHGSVSRQSETGGSTATVLAVSTDSWTLSEQGTFGNGTLSLSSYVVSEQQSSSVTVSQSGNSTETLSGLNQGQSYSGSDDGTTSSTSNSNSSCSLDGQGSDQINYPIYRFLSYSASGSDSFSNSQSDSSNWSGGYSGSGSDNDSQSGNSS